MKIELAGIIIDIKEPGEYTVNMCKDYIYSGEKEADITIENDPVALEKEKKQSPGLADDYIQNVCIYRAICKKIVDFEAMLIHSAAIAVDNEGYLFTALSGTGKTTHVNLWLKKFGDRAVIINGDKPIVRKIDGKFHVFGTPWCGKEGINFNTCVPIKGICVLERGKQNKIQRISHSLAVSKLLEQTSRPNTVSGMNALLDIMDKLITEIPVYRLSCNMEPEACEVSYNEMCKN